MENYRIDAPVIERIELGKILMMQDRNVQNKFNDVPLLSITFESILNASKEKTCHQGQRSNQISAAEDQNESHEKRSDEGPDESKNVSVKSQKRPSDYECPTSNKKVCRSPLTKKEKRVHVSWSNVEDELRKVFSVCYDELKTPRRGYITLMLKQVSVSQDLKSRGVERIMKKISADVNKMKKKNPKNG